jgi:hypothetical protein
MPSGKTLAPELEELTLRASSQFRHPGKKK